MHTYRNFQLDFNKNIVNINEKKENEKRKGTTLNWIVMFFFCRQEMYLDALGLLARIDCLPSGDLAALVEQIGQLVVARLADHRAAQLVGRAQVAQKVGDDDALLLLPVGAAQEKTHRLV